MVRINHTQQNIVFGMVFGAESKVSAIQQAVEQRTGMPVHEQRLIFGGRELDGNKTLEELNVHPKEVLHLLPRLPHVCREWAATGSCSRGRRCYQKATHTVEFSPRYVEHHAKNPGQNSASPSESSTPSASPPSSPEQGPAKIPGPPIAPRPPAYGALGTNSRRRPPYGMLGGDVIQPAVAQADWKGGYQGISKPNLSEQSNSGDWDGLISAITSVTLEVAEEVEVEEDLDEERSWEEKNWDAAMSAAAMGFSCDSSYDSQSSMCGADRMPDLDMNQLNLGPACTEALEKQQPMPCESKAPLEPKTAGLEFAAGVHLIEEMENQVKQWEETESTRQVAYNAWVHQQMMQRAAMHAGDNQAR